MADSQKPIKGINAKEFQHQMTKLAYGLHMSTAIKNPTLLKLLETEQPAAEKLHYDWAVTEIECARTFNFELNHNLPLAVEQMEEAVHSITGTQKNVILVFDEQSGVYTCLNDEKNAGEKPRELTQISDSFLRDLLGTEEALHTHLIWQDTLVGIVAVADKENSKPLNVNDEITLELLSNYLATKVMRYMALKQSLIIPYKQQKVLEIASELISAVDQDHIITGVLEHFGNEFDFGVCQYVSLNPQSGHGEVLYEKQSGRVKSFTHAGLKGKRKVVTEFTSLVSLLSSVARTDAYLHLSGKMLGDKSLSSMFSVKNIQSALIIPAIDLATGQIKGTFNLYRTKSGVIPSETIDIVNDVIQLVANALGRAAVLEKALAMASCDELTGLLNRRGFYERFESEIERAKRHPTKVSVAIIDVDHFKAFNDKFGHLSGDLVLKAVAELFNKNLRKSDVICRFGGEEFAILLPDTELQAATDLMDRLRGTLEKLTIYGFKGETLKVTISAGITELNLKDNANLIKKGSSKALISDVLAMADEQLYKAKNSGRNQVSALAIGPDTE